MTDAETRQVIEDIRARNQRVETDKAWELSWTRRLFIAAVTYATAGVWLEAIRDSYPWLKAFVPTAGYILSTLTVPFVKKFWTTHQKRP